LRVAEETKNTHKIIIHPLFTAVGITLRPNARNFSRYMKALFESELAEEQISQWAKTKIYFAAEPEVENKPPLPEDDYEETLIPGKTRETSGQYR
jgi:hypothetical protein